MSATEVATPAQPEPVTPVKTAAGPAVAPAGAPPGLLDYGRDFVARIRGGDMGALPAILGLLVLCVAFAIMRERFLSAINFANLFTQGAAVTAIAMGLVFVLLLGEIDLSAGFASGVCAAVMATLIAEHGQPWWVAMLAAVGTGIVIGLVLGFLVARVGIPSFVVTLAAFLAFQGAVLLIIGQGGNVSIRDETIVAIANKNLPVYGGWILFAVLVLGFGASQLMRSVNRRRSGLTADPISVVALRTGALAVLAGFAVYVLNLERSRTAIVSLKGVPIVVPVILVLVVIGTYVLNRTSYGRHIYAVGGNAEAARRAGINVVSIRISCFVICSSMAAVGGIIAASRATSVDPNAGGSNTLLYAVGAAVIGGTSLFGGKGRIIDAVLGGAVVAVIDNGMGLMGYSAGVKFIVTGCVLALAASVDALSRKRAASTGRI
ncbi:ABC transporter permease [Frankia sp. CNm7]|uniref:Xylose transport system permease protein XylH n=1 Tax=Frankia nepalensis TaxID=1836974 RepID=A0A937R940_9ACTN|nr:ABC transporter permease [Frankia nepalensis]MBL7500316.1 ABC transporter permease [Frankia nepalensis]MBL7508538.1 ABC transporter permease [Frankia nepalensis]MBL7520421.1 ABC transporter permease [Frankia nepalensis]MBL7627666.1 ABC transporter permease [Frankia nepalensis]